MTLKYIYHHLGLGDHIIFDLPTGERFLINDINPSGLKTAYALNIERNVGVKNIYFKGVL